ncbi:MAG: phosphate acyltransferase PlsX [Bacteroidia bacterium]
MRIGLDISGGDFAPDATLDGAILAVDELPVSTQVVLIGNREQIANGLIDRGKNPADFEIVHAPDIIGMGDNPTKAFASKTDSSISVGFRLLKEKQIDAFTGAGNTGAMLVGAVLSVKPIEGVQRPCIMSLVPKESGKFGILLDVGSNADCKPETLVQFAQLGSTYAETVLGISQPAVGLINIGEEPEKGNAVTLAAHQLLKNSGDIHFIGNIEGRDLFNDKADVMVCDGFTGNVVLKLMEAFYGIYMKSGVNSEYINRFNYESYGGTPILGINSTVIVGHGISNANAIKNMIKLAHQVESARLTEKIKEIIQHD